MNQLRKLLDVLRPAPKSPDVIAAQAEADRLRDEMKTRAPAVDHVASVLARHRLRDLASRLRL